MTSPEADVTPSPAEADPATETNSATGLGAPSGDDALGAAGRALAAIENLPLERHPEAFAHVDELLRAALEAPPHVASG